jgi:hypothetical protein
MNTLPVEYSTLEEGWLEKIDDRCKVYYINEELNISYLKYIIIIEI